MAPAVRSQRGGRGERGRRVPRLHVSVCEPGADVTPSLTPGPRWPAWERPEAAQRHGAVRPHCSTWTLAAHLSPHPSQVGRRAAWRPASSDPPLPLLPLNYPNFTFTGTRAGTLPGTITGCRRGTPLRVGPHTAPNPRGPPEPGLRPAEADVGGPGVARSLTGGGQNSSPESQKTSSAPHHPTRHLTQAWAWEGRPPSYLSPP